MEINFKQCNSGNYSKGRTQNIKYLVIHYTSNKGDTAKNNADYFAREITKSSAHYFVDENEVWQSVNDTDTAWHCGAKNYAHPSCRNANSIGIEICMNDKSGNVRYGSIETAIELAKEIMVKYNIPIENVLRHYDITGKNCLPLDNTEVLSKKGWLRLDEVSVGDEISAYLPENDSIEFQKIIDIVPPYEDEVISCRKIEATFNHRMYTKPNCYNSKIFRETKWGEILQGSQLNLIKNGAMYHGKGLNLSDDEIKLLVWVQGDGHYMKNKNNAIIGLEFHLKKERKIIRIKNLLNELDIYYTVCNKSDKSVSIRIYDKKIVDWCEEWLDGKNFSFKFIEMTKEQFEIFWEEIVVVDGHVSKNTELYTSTIEQNLDIVQALCATKGIRSNKTNMGDFEKYKHPTSLIISRSNYSVGGVKKTITKRETMVSCVTVPSGYILIRQNGRTFIVGNCPAPMIENEQLWIDFKNALANEEEDEMKIYKWINEMPEWAQDTFTRLMKAGYVNKNADGSISVWESSLQPMVYLDRLTGNRIEQFRELLNK